MPGVAQPAKGAMLLASFWMLGAHIGAVVYGSGRGKDVV